MKKTQSGRSMIEMLGVLAIIGVLSVGGIAGYSDAMRKYRVNKTINQISNIAANVRILYSQQRSYAGLSTETSDGRNIIDKAQLLPKEMKDGTSYQNPFAGKVTVKAAGRFDANDNKAFVIIYEGIPQEAAVDLATINWGTGANGGLIALGLNADVSDTLASLASAYNMQSLPSSVWAKLGEAILDVFIGRAEAAASVSDEPISEDDSPTEDNDSATSSNNGAIVTEGSGTMPVSTATSNVTSGSNNVISVKFY